MVIVTAAVIEKNRKILIARRKTGISLGDLWEFPGGTLEEGEDPRECLRRVLFEKFGIKAQIDDLVMSSVREYEHVKVELRSYRARYKGGAITLVDHDKLVWVGPEEFSQYELAPADLPTIEALLRERAFRNL